MDMTAAATSVATSVTNYQVQSSLLAIRLAAESQSQIVDLLAQSVVPASSPAHLGGQIDTYA